MGRVAGKIAIVTGGGTGIGRAAATRLAEEGAIVTIAEFDAANGQAVAEELGGDAAFVEHDVREEASWQNLMKSVADRHGRPDILVNNAGILATNNNQELAVTDLEQWRAVQQVNVEGVFLGCKYGVDAMIANGGRAKGGAGGGAIVNMSSIAGLVATAHLVAYGASKGAVRQMTKSVAIDCAKKGLGIRCNSVHPGVIVTNMGNQVMGMGNGNVEANWEARLNLVPMGEPGQAVDVANCILFLASDEARHITGAELVVDGGMTAI
ncbi:MAG: glucose 1-dehydrogenase [Rhodospirillaceae bacterium]|nr:glucose 1-dehydrogenase [Rhodospirillaceae bacterium]MBT4686663.1 glucose 1-dehydrogenase [Rhodospirillaceae bacterium]MBT5082249.1 glucose 1-dehydrogenase [Rhodospirillaceae bacterium]MBT5526768.1 glucose 1-dehydrogenase [Rhodospirillaceae bacterium]MBT5879133.1 glucose 1-dehydrogenase [Rhodospirillaceae bacterium]